MEKVRPDSQELHGIQMLRGVAALAVVVHHTLRQSDGAIGRFSPDWLTIAGASGVDIFFVISGFIMLFVSFRPGRRPPTAGKFLFRRATRIYPFYWLCCLAILAISAAGFLASHSYSASDVAESLLLLPGSKLIDVAWTLVYEVYFYILFAATLWLRSTHITLIGSTTAIIFLYCLSGSTTPSVLRTFLSSPMPIEFCFGMMLAQTYLMVQARHRRWPMALPASTLGLTLMVIAPMLFVLPTAHEHPPLLRVGAWGVPAVLVVAGVLNIGSPRHVLVRFCLLLGDASYALYLTHVFVMIGYGRLIKVASVSRLPQQPVAVVVVLVAVAIGMAAHLLVEKPLLRPIRRIKPRQPGHAGSAVPA